MVGRSSTRLLRSSTMVTRKIGNTCTTTGASHCDCNSWQPTYTLSTTVFSSALRQNTAGLEGVSHVGSALHDALGADEWLHRVCMEQSSTWKQHFKLLKVITTHDRWFTNVYKCQLNGCSSIPLSYCHHSTVYSAPAVTSSLCVLGPPLTSCPRFV